MNVTLSRSAETCFLRAVEVQHGGPLSFALGVPHHFAAEHAGDGLRREVAMEVEVAAIQLLVPLAKAQGQVRRVVLGGGRFCGESSSRRKLSPPRLVQTYFTVRLTWAL